MIPNEIEQFVSLRLAEPGEGDVRLLLSAASTVGECVRLVEVSVKWNRLWAMRLAGVALNRLLADADTAESMDLHRAVGTLTSAAFHTNDGALTQSCFNAMGWLVQSESGLETVSFDQSAMSEFILRAAFSDHPNDRSAVVDLLERVSDFGAASVLLGRDGIASLRNGFAQMSLRDDMEGQPFPFEIEGLVDGF